MYKVYIRQYNLLLSLLRSSSFTEPKGSSSLTEPKGVL